MNIDLEADKRTLERLATEAAKVPALREEIRHLRRQIERQELRKDLTPCQGEACPFCAGGYIGVSSVLRDGCADGEPDAWAAAVECYSCGTVGPWRKADDAATAKVRALNEWNKRYESPRIDAMRAESREVVVMYANIARRLGWTNGGMIDAFSAMADALDTFHRHIGAEPGSAPLVKVLEWAAEDHLEAEHLRTVERELRDVLSIDDDADIVDAVRELIKWRDNLFDGAKRVCEALNKQGALSARDNWHLDAARVIRERGESQARVLALEDRIRERGELQANVFALEDRIRQLVQTREALDESHDALISEINEIQAVLKIAGECDVVAEVRRVVAERDELRRPPRLDPDTAPIPSVDPPPDHGWTRIPERQSDGTLWPQPGLEPAPLWRQVAGQRQVVWSPFAGRHAWGPDIDPRNLGQPMSEEDACRAAESSRQRCGVTADEPATIPAVYPFPPSDPSARPPTLDERLKAAEDELAAMRPRLAAMEAAVRDLAHLRGMFLPLPAGWTWTQSALNAAGGWVGREGDGTWNAESEHSDVPPVRGKASAGEAIAALPSKRTE